MSAVPTAGALPLKVLRAMWRAVPQRLRYGGVRVVGRAVHRSVDFMKVWRVFAGRAKGDAPGRSTGSCIVIGLFETRCGLARAAWLNALALQRAGYAVQLFAWRADTQTLTLHGTLPAPQVSDLPDLLLAHLHPPDSTRALAAWHGLKRPTPRKVAYWVWETETAPLTWRLHALPFDELWTPSAFAARALRICGRSVRVMPHPCALAVRPLALESGAARRLLGLPSSGFVAAFAFDLRSNFERKNPLGLVAAFRRAFPEPRDARLVIRMAGERWAPELAHRLREAVGSDPAIVLVDETTPIDALYAACDVYVSLHRAEGFGLTLAEAMLHGKPVIASGWSGNLTFMTADDAMLVPCTMTPIRDPQNVYSERQVWAEPDLDAAAEALRTLAGSLEHRLSLGRRGQIHVEAQLSGFPSFSRALPGSKP